MNFASPPAAEDLVHTPDEHDPLWSESFGHWSTCNKNQISFFTHFQRNQKNRSLWRELIIIKLDPETALVGKSYGINTDPKNPSANGLSIECIDPFKAWRVRFDGAVREVPISKLMTEAFSDGVWQPARFVLECQAHGPAWTLAADQNDGAWSTAHYEQAYSFRGELNLVDRAYKLDGLGLRDHSYGLRNSGIAGEAQWFNGQFPSGRSFSVIRAATPDGRFFDSAHVVQDGQLLDAKIEDLSPLKHPEREDLIAIRLSTDHGTHNITGTIEDRLPISILEPSEQVPGRVSDGASLCYYDAGLRYAWDGETGTGFANLVFPDRAH